jgi:hypothetical protein
MDDDAWSAVRLFGRILWDHGFWGLITSTLWGLLFAAFGVAIALGGWFAVRKRGLLDLGTKHDPWLRGGTLALWLVVVPSALGLAGMAYGAERATIAAMHEERVVAHACRGAALAVTEPVVRQVATWSGMAIAADEPCPRVAMQQVWSLRERGHEAISAIELHLVDGGEVEREDDEDLTEATKRYVARQTLDYARDAVLTDNDEVLAQYLRDVEGHVAADGTVGVEDFATVLATRVLEPQADAVVSSAFASMRWPLYLVAIGALAGPLALLAGLRWYRRRRRTNP